MPHFDLLKNKELNKVEEYYYRASLHYVECSEIIASGDLAHGVSVLFDAFLNAMRWKALRKYNLKIPVDKDLAELLIEKKELPTNFDFLYWENIVEEIIDEDFSNYDESLISKLSFLIEQLGIVERENIFDEVRELPDKK